MTNILKKINLEVRWVNACFHLCNISKNVYGPRHYSMTQHQVKGMKVIGSIYEPPDLIEIKK